MQKLGKFFNALICIGFIILLVGLHILLLVSIDHFKFDSLGAGDIAHIGAFILIGIELIFIYRSYYADIHPLVILVPGLVAIGAGAYILMGGPKVDPVTQPYLYMVRFSIAPTAGLLILYQLVGCLEPIEKKKEKYDWLINLVIPLALTVASLGAFMLLTKLDYKNPNWDLNFGITLSLVIGGGVAVIPAAIIGILSAVAGGSGHGSSSRSSGGSSSSGGSGKKMSEKDVWYLVYGKEGWAGSCKAKIEDVNISGRSGSGQMYHSSFSITATIEVKVRLSSYQSQTRMEEDINKAARAAMNSAEDALRRAGVGYEINCRVKPVQD